MAFVNRLFKTLRPDEASLVLSLSVILLSNSVAQKISEISSISNFISDVGVPQLLLVWVVDGIILLVTTGLQSLLIDRFNRVTLIKGFSFGLAVAYVFLRILFLFGAPKWITYSLFYLFSQQQAFFFPLVVWVLGNDLFDIVQSKRIFPFIANWELMGNLLGIGFAALAPMILLSQGTRPEELLIINVLIYMLIYGLASLTLKSVRPRGGQIPKSSMSETLTEGLDFVQGVPAFRFFAIAMLCLWLCDTILEFHFFIVSEASFVSASTYQTFYSLIVLARILGYMFIQRFLTERVMAGVGLKNTFFIAPLFSLGGSALMLGIPSLLGAISGIFTHKLPLFSISETAARSFQGLVPEERRGRVSIFIDSYLNAIGSIVGAMLIGMVILAGILFNFREISQYIYLALGVAAAMGALWATFRMRAVYDQSLLNWRLKRRQRGKSILDNIEF